MDKVLIETKHNLCTPILTLKTGCHGINEFIAKLIQGYKLAVTEKLMMQEVSDQQLELLKKVIGNMETATDQIENELNTLFSHLEQN